MKATFTIGVDFDPGPLAIFSAWLSSKDVSEYKRARWLLEQLNAMEDKGHIGGNCLINGATGDQVWLLSQGDYCILYRYKRVSRFDGQARIFDAFRGNEDEGRRRAATTQRIK